MSTVSGRIVKWRAAFDLGSGTMKLQVGGFDENDNLCSLAFGTERPMYFGEAWQKSKDGSLGLEIQERGIELLKTLKKLAESHGATEYFGVATEVFRKASDGNIFLEKVRTEVGVPTIIVTQKMEAAIGYATGLASLQILPGFSESVRNNMTHPDRSNGLIIWDSGAASFQMTTRNPARSPDGEKNASGEYCAYMAPYGTSVVNTILRSIKCSLAGEDLAHAQDMRINPVSATAVEMLIERLTSSLPGEIPDWLRYCNEKECSVNSLTENPSGAGSAPVIISIGGKSSMFQTARRVMLVSGQLRDSESNICTIRLSDVKHCIELCTNRTNEELQKYCDYEHPDSPGSTVSKLCLLYSVMQRLGLRSISAVCTVGGCSGVLNSADMWEKGL